MGDAITLMRQCPTTSAPFSFSPHFRKCQRGASILELVITMAVASIMAAISVPMIQNTTRALRLNAAVSAVTGTMQSTRYRAIYDGCPYAVSFVKATNTYQLSSEVTGGACANALTNVGSAIPFADPKRVSLDQDVTFQFSPGGSVTVTTGTNSFNLTAVGTANPKNIKVTKYGSITVQ
jgi:Tfp pilus assembly protein FimT